MQNPYSHGVGILEGKGSKPTPEDSFLMEKNFAFYPLLHSLPCEQCLAHKVLS